MSDGYPSFLLFLVLAVGVPLASVNPYRAFLLAVLLLTAGHVDAFNHTRTAALGAYFNLTDACMLIAVVALLFDRLNGRGPVWVPQIVVLMLLVVIIATAQSLCRFGWSYETMRAFRWAIQFPLACFLGANLVASKDRARRLVGILLAGALLAAIQHVAFVSNVWRTQSLNMETYERMRTIGYWAGCMPAAFLTAAVCWSKPRGAMKVSLYMGAGLLLLASLFLNQTRSLWFATAATVPISLLLFRGQAPLKRIVTFSLLLCLAGGTFAWIVQRTMPGLSVASLLTDRMELLTSDKTIGVHVGTRERALNAEMAQWWNGTLLLGRGLYFYQDVQNSEKAMYKVAFGHLGYVTYLSQIGLIGFFVYGLVLPLWVLRNARVLWQQADSSPVQFLGLLGGTSIICLSIMFMASSHFLGMGYEAPGILYGAMGSLVRIREMRSDHVTADHVLADLNPAIAST